MRTANVAMQPEFGLHGAKWAPAVLKHLKRFKPVDILDYGCGSGSLGEALRREGHQVREYDPAVEGKTTPPMPADFVTCIGVLEHIEPVNLGAVLNDLARVTRKAGFFTIGLAPSKHILPDGRNAHLIIKPQEWWLGRLATRFSGVDPQPWRSVKGREITNEMAVLCFAS